MNEQHLFPTSIQTESSNQTNDEKEEFMRDNEYKNYEDYNLMNNNVPRNSNNEKNQDNKKKIMSKPFNKISNVSNKERNSKTKTTPNRKSRTVKIKQKQTKHLAISRNRNDIIPHSHETALSSMPNIDKPGTQQPSRVMRTQLSDDEIILPRQSNRCPDREKYILSTYAEFYYKDVVNIEAMKSYYETPNNDKDVFLFNFMMKYFHHKRVLEYNEKEKVYHLVSHQDLFILIKKRFKNLRDRCVSNMKYLKTQSSNDFNITTEVTKHTDTAIFDTKQPSSDTINPTYTDNLTTETALDKTETKYHVKPHTGTIYCNDEKSKQMKSKPMNIYKITSNLVRSFGKTIVQKRIIEKENDLLSRKNKLVYLYTPDEEITGHESWNYYSMIHSVSQSFRFVVYNGSHKLKDNTTVHACTRSVIQFPSNVNCFILFHGRLVHSGAESKQEGTYSHNVPFSYNTSHDVRFFSYLTTLDKEVQQQNESTSENHRDTIPSLLRSISNKYENKTEQGKVDTNTFSLCSYFSTKICEKCKSYKSQFSTSKSNTMFDIVFDIKSIINDMPKRSSTNSITRITGDMDSLGWEVYYGENFHDVKYFPMFTELRNLLSNDSRWKGIASTSRKILKVSETENQKYTNEISFAFDEIHNKYLNKLPRFQNRVVMESKAILANFRCVSEQNPHRDYGQVKK